MSESRDRAVAQNFPLRTNRGNSVLSSPFNSYDEGALFLRRILADFCRQGPGGVFRSFAADQNAPETLFQHDAGFPVRLHFTARSLRVIRILISADLNGKYPGCNRLRSLEDLDAYVCGARSDHLDGGGRGMGEIDN